MTRPSTRIFKRAYDGLTAKSTAELTIDGKLAQLSIETSKTNYPKGEIITTATIGWISADGIGVVHALGLGRGYAGDFYVTVERTTARATEKAISTLHNKALDRYDAIVAQALAYYVAKAAAKASEV
jgi:hypothetical protein